ncbi:MAG: DNA mismatch repair endonuclease MutL [Solobacterium sp.]|jgi:DNA mismatch repair protein MutL|nr:DNA mismatch repair endonuclease MutL [Solobacterium sp.]MCH4049112.1 DNA mismatch repair endonuclease MutL [Solobacterium sp.]MCH4074134.1 DNA mismatch repair endonuclease MutL [Solobacterium sp.]MCI1314208.1 DNA mismatch repair endonuclease MutL [Solobacterium sp.]MCI1346350.1 DNA mismatch repair endonuclease MutL [Solobacterium sp.]
MSRIQKLDTQTANMIAAGEVVERPRGVVKELVENAMDAGATRIIIAMEQGGLSKLSVEDNGIGMDHADARMAFERHATSKIHKESDLWNIHTMGFRGEALPSIASVSRLTMLTSDGSDGTKVVMSYGKEEVYEDAPAPQGTKITVEGLFYETPARLKHMRSAAYEGSLIQSLVQAFALGRPDIAFRLYHEGRECFRTSGSGSLQEVVYQVFGRGAAENAIPVDFEDYDYHVTGCIIRPFINRASRYGMHIFLNRRMVKENRLYKAILDGYQGFLQEGRYPLAVVNVDMDPHIIDVNVHPSKWEVRLSKQNQLEYLLKDQIHEALTKAMNAKEEEPEVISGTVYVPLSFSDDEMRPTPQEEMKVAQDSPAYAADQKEEKPLTCEAEQKADEAILQKVTPAEETEPEEEEEKIPFPSYTVIGQYRKDYILCACEQGLMVVHIARMRQRISYEEDIRRMKTSKGKQDLLVPLTLHVSAADVERADELNAAIADTGIVFEPFGSDTLLVRSMPLWLCGQDIEEEKLLCDLCEIYLKEEHKVDVCDLAAREAVKYMKENHRSLTMDEMKKYMEQLQACDNAFTDPFGRAIVIIVDEKHLLRSFG